MPFKRVTFPFPKTFNIPILSFLCVLMICLVTDRSFQVRAFVTIDSAFSFACSPWDPAGFGLTFANTSQFPSATCLPAMPSRRGSLNSLLSPPVIKRHVSLIGTTFFNKTKLHQQNDWSSKRPYTVMKTLTSARTTITHAGV